MDSDHSCSAAEGGNGIRVLMFPWLGHGHVSPFLELAKKLSNKNLQIYFCSTPITLSPIKEKPTSIQFVDLHLPSLPELPPHYHTTKGLPPHLMNSLKKAFDMVSPSFTEILNHLKPDLLISDSYQPWALTAASSLNIPSVLFTTSAANLMPFGIQYVNVTSDPFPPANLMATQFAESASMGDYLVYTNCLVLSYYLSSNVMLINTSREIEAKYIEYLSILTNKKVIPTGPLVLDLKHDDENMEITEWLDKKERFSAVFVSFGTECFLSKGEIEEIAYGLELSKVNFIWVLRFPAEEKISVEEALPEGFTEMVGERGMIIKNWAPQKRILRHQSIGGFLSHCGWNSVMESVKFRVPIIGMPIQYDQPYNAKLAEEIGVGVEIRKDENGRFEREEIAKAIKAVVVEKSGEKLRRKAKEISDRMVEKEEKAMDEVVDVLTGLCGRGTTGSLASGKLDSVCTEFACIYGSWKE